MCIYLVNKGKSFQVIGFIHLERISQNLSNSRSIERFFNAFIAISREMVILIFLYSMDSNAITLQSKIEFWLVDSAF